MAETLAQQARDAGIAVRLLRADAYPTLELQQERHLYVVISTQGDGDPPDDARGLVDFFARRLATALTHLRYTVLGLGASRNPPFVAGHRRADGPPAALC